jgi:hypothetical protein
MTIAFCVFFLDFMQFSGNKFLGALFVEFIEAKRAVRPTLAEKAVYARTHVIHLQNVLFGAGGKEANTCQHEMTSVTAGSWSGVKVFSSRLYAGAIAGYLGYEPPLAGNVPKKVLKRPHPN